MSESSPDQSAEVPVSVKRAWLKANGKPVGDRGKLSKENEDAYRAGQVQGQPQL